MGYAVYGDAILANIGSTWDSEGKCVYGDVTLNNYHRTPRGAYKLSRQAVAVADLPSTYSCQSQWQDSTLENAALQEETSIDCTDEDKSDQEGFFRTRYDAIQSAAQKAVHHYNTWCESGPHPPTHNMSRHDLSNFSELSSLTACGKCKCNEDMAGDATLFASTNGLEKTELENLLEGQHEFEFELGADGRFPLEYMVKPIKGVWSFGRGCRSGDLFNSLLKEPSSLRQIMGVDISQKTLIRAAKALQRTLTTQKPGHSCPLESLQKLSLYEGSITDMDPQLHAPDVATCIETAARFDYEVRFVGVGGDKEYEDIINDDTAEPGFAIQVAIFSHNSVLFPIVRKEGELPALLACDLSRVTSEFTFHSGVCTHSDQQNMNYETSPKVIADPFTFKELWHWTTPRSSEATACCSNMENLSIYQADEECITCS
ncbi:unnamed protein product [Sphagnum jensenii]